MIFVFLRFSYIVRYEKKLRRDIQDFSQHEQYVNRPVSSAVDDIDIGAQGLGFNPWAYQIEHTVANGLPLPRRFFGAMLRQR